MSNELDEEITDDVVNSLSLNEQTRKMAQEMLNTQMLKTLQGIANDPNAEPKDILKAIDLITKIAGAGNKAVDKKEQEKEAPINIGPR